MKYIIELEEQYFGDKNNPEPLYRAKGFRTLVFDLNGISKLKKLNEYDQEGWNITGERIEKIRKEAYEKGLDDAWELSAEIFNEYNRKDMEGLFCEGSQDPLTYCLFCEHSAEDAKDMLEDYKKKMSCKIRVGDEVEAWDTNKYVKFVCLADADHNGGYIVGIDSKGGMFEYPASDCRKTGKRFDVLRAIQNMKEEDLTKEDLPWV